MHYDESESQIDNETLSPENARWISFDFLQQIVNVFTGDLRIIAVPASVAVGAVDRLLVDLVAKWPDRSSSWHRLVRTSLYVVAH